MSTYKKPLQAAALGAYAVDIKTILGAETAAADVRDEILALDGIGGDAGRARYQHLAQVMQFGNTQLLNGGVASFAVGAGGADYVIGDKVTVTTSTGQGGGGIVNAVSGLGAITGVTVIEGAGYAAGDTATTVTSENGSGATVTATIQKDEQKLLVDALALLTA